MSKRYRGLTKDGHHNASSRKVPKEISGRLVPSVQSRTVSGVVEGGRGSLQ